MSEKTTPYSSRRRLSGSQHQDLKQPRRRLTRQPEQPPLPVTGFYSAPEPQTRERETQVTGVSEGTVLPLAYGNTRIGGDLILVGKTSYGDLVLAYLFTLAANGIGGALEKKINGDDPQDLGVTLNFYDGTQTTVDLAIFQSYGSNHPERYTGAAYASLRVSANSRIFGALPEVHILGNWRKVWDPRGQGSWWASDNPALIALDLLRSVDAGGLPDSLLDLHTFADVANFCDQVVHGVKRYKAGGVIRLTGSPVAEANRVLGLFGGGITYSANGQIAAWIRRDDVDASGEIDTNTQIAGDGERIEAQLEHVSAVEIPAKVGCKYVDPGRAEEQIIWWVNPRFPIFGSPSGEQVFDGQLVTDAITAARLAHDQGLALVAAPLKAKCRTLDSFTVGDVWRFDPYSTSPQAAVCSASAPWQATGVGSGSVPGTVLNVSASIRLDSGSGTIVEKGADPNGFAVSIAKNQITVRLAGNTYALPAVIPYGVPVQFELIWRASDGTLVLYQHGERISETTTTGVSSVATSAGYTLGAFNGALEWVLCGGAYNLAQARFRSIWNSSPPGSWDLYFLRGQYQRGSGSVPTLEPFPPAFWVTRCDPAEDGSYYVELEQWRVRSRATGQTETTGAITVQRYDTKPTVDQVKPTPSPPPVTNLWLSVVEDTSTTPYTYKIRAGWYLPNYPYVRGVRVILDDGSGDVTVGTFGRGSSEVVIPVLKVGVQHTVKVYTLDNFGNASSDVTNTITPGPVNFGVSVNVSGHYYQNLGIRRDLMFGGLQTWIVRRWATLSLSVTNAPAIERIEIAADGVTLGALPPDRTSAVIVFGTPTSVFSGSSGTTSGDLAGSFSAGSTVTARAIGKNGSIVEASAAVPPATAYGPNQWGVQEGAITWIDSYGNLNTSTAGGTPEPVGGIWETLLRVPSWNGQEVQYRRVIFATVTPSSSPATYAVPTGSWRFVVSEASGASITWSYSTTSNSVTILNGQGQTFNILGVEV